jgi:ubiquinone/menaquinone biosynthesis C-methylase UbiE
VSSGYTLQEWSETAKFWTRHRHTIRTMFAPLTLALIEHAGIVHGKSVLDVAGGAGEPSLTIAETVGPAGSVMCTDPIPEMIAAAEADARERGLTNVQFRVCTADALPFEDNNFDVVVSRLGAMFFPDPLAALKEMLRVIRPGGRVALVVWHKSEVNPFCYIITDVVARHVTSPPADPDAPNAFRFAEEGKLAEILKNAGATNVVERVVKFDLAAPISSEEFWSMRSETSDTLRAKLRTVSGEQRQQIADEVNEAVKEFFLHGHMNFPTQMLILTGTKSSQV